MSKALLARIHEFCHEPIYLGDWLRETNENCWCISASQTECDGVSVAEVASAMEDVIAYVRKLVAAQADWRGALFHLWFDEQASQLRCCVISDRNAALPFRCETEQVSSMEPIIIDFLSSPYHDGIPWEEFIAWEELTDAERSDIDEDEGGRDTPLQVYAEQMP